MADGGTIAEFLVALGFKIDESGQRRIESGLKSVSDRSTDAQKKVAELEKKVRELQEQLGKTSGEPARKFGEFAHKVGQLTHGLGQSFKEFAGSATAAVGAFVGAMQLVASNYTQLGRTAREMGTSVADLKAVRLAAEQAGIGADNVTNALLGMTQKIRENRGIDLFVQRWTKVPWEQIANKGRDGLLPILEGLEQIYKEQGPQAAYALGNIAGVNQRMIDQFHAQPEVMRRAITAAGDLYQRIGVDQEDAARKAEAWNNQLKTISESFGGIYTQAFTKAQPAFQSTFNAIERGLGRVHDWNRANPGLGLAEAVGLTISGLQSLVPMLSTVGIKLNLMNPIVLGFAAGATLIMANWDKLEPYFANKFQRITEAYKEGGLEAAIAETGRVAGDVFKDLGSWIATSLSRIDWKALWDTIVRTASASWSAITDFIADIDWGAVGETIATGLLNGIAWLISAEGGGKLLKAILRAGLDIAEAGMQLGIKLAEGLIRGIIRFIAGKGRFGEWLIRQLGISEEQQAERTEQQRTERQTRRERRRAADEREAQMRARRRGEPEARAGEQIDLTDTAALAE
ncbi:MAG: hypothetical protein J2P48_11660, partial [Alphaproteobacteria bacterium]|nr:hypothetical protein [Alphaproteobacteria bacterium]